MLENTICLPSFSTATGSVTTYCAFLAINPVYHSTAGGTTLVFAASSALLAMPVARVTYCDMTLERRNGFPPARDRLMNGGFHQWVDRP